MSKILITGGAGFIGSAFIRQLNEASYHDILIVDHLGNTKKWQNINNKHFSQYSSC